MRVLVTGGSGQLAHAIQRFWTDHELIVPTETVLDLSRPVSIYSVIKELKPDVVINSGAFTQVDRCETEVELARRVNGEAVRWLADACSGVGALLVQISTDYVFDGQGTRPYIESDPVNPISIYGKSKLLGEQEASLAKDFLILRTAWLYDAWGANFYTTMLKLAAKGNPIKVVDDQRGTPTTCRALARQIQAAVETSCRGILHATCSGDTTWYGFAAEIFKQNGLHVDLTPCHTADFPRPAARPAYSVLSGQKKRQSGDDVMQGWREALAEVVTGTTTYQDEVIHG